MNSSASGKMFTWWPALSNLVTQRTKGETSVVLVPKNLLAIFAADSSNLCGGLSRRESDLFLFPEDSLKPSRSKSSVNENSFALCFPILAAVNLDLIRRPA